MDAVAANGSGRAGPALRRVPAEDALSGAPKVAKDAEKRATVGS
jgi:hypothetical protein